MTFFASEEVAPSDTSAGITVGSVRISGLSGNIHLNDLAYYSRTDEPVWTASSLSLSIGTWKSLQMGILPAGYVLASLNETNAVINDWKFNSTTSDDGLKASFTLYGQPFDLFPILSEGRFPLNSMRLQMDAHPIDGAVLVDILSNFYQVPEAMQILSSSQNNTFAGELAIDPFTGRISLNSAEIRSEENASLIVNLGLHYDELDVERPEIGIIGKPSRFNLSVTGSLPDEGAFSLIPIGEAGSLNFKSLQWSTRGNLSESDTLLTTEIIYNAEHTTVTIEQPVWFPNSEFLGQANDILTIFGIPTNRFDFQLLTIDYGLRPENSIEISSLELKHLNFRSSFSGQLNLIDNGEISNAPIRGTIRIDQMTEGLLNASYNIEEIFGLQIRRDGNAITFPVSGTLANPSIF
ncbi:MAG: hypothetical protein LAT57_05410 [Balneolales bacterium]|nr:hypothetical protein [Balneolales bacterium]